MVELSLCGLDIRSSQQNWIYPTQDLAVQERGLVPGGLSEKSSSLSGTPIRLGIIFFFVLSIFPHRTRGR